MHRVLLFSVLALSPPRLLFGAVAIVSMRSVFILFMYTLLFHSLVVKSYHAPVLSCFLAL